MARKSYKGENNPNFKHGLYISGSNGAYEAKKRRVKAYPEKESARNKVYQAIKYGSLKRGNCQICGQEKAEAHHKDYSKPFDIMWLCKKHHAELHAKENSLKGTINKKS